MRAARKNVTGNKIDLNWDVTLCTSIDFQLIYGDMATVATPVVDGSVCGLGISGSAGGVPLPPGDLWFLVVATDGNLIEGSWGQGASGERGGVTPSFECGVTVRDNGGSCP